MECLRCKAKATDPPDNRIRLIDHGRIRDGLRMVTYSICCLNCGLIGQDFDSKEEALADWAAQDMANAVKLSDQVTMLQRVKGW